MSNSNKGNASQADKKKARLAEQLRQNLRKRKAQSGAKRGGEADGRQDGLGQQKPVGKDD